MSATEQFVQFQQCERNDNGTSVSGHFEDHEECQQVLDHLCHDVTLLLATVRTLAEVASGEPDVAPPVLRRLQQLTSETEKISELCGNVLERPQLAAVRLDLAAVKAVESARLAHGVDIELSTLPVTLNGHSSSIWRLIANLVDNACRSAGPLGSVRVSVGESATGVYVDVAGSAHDLRETRHSKRSAPRSRPPLGLRIVDGIVKQHGGSVEARRCALGGIGLRVFFPT
jgi:signal transduction histidine kinase